MEPVHLTAAEEDISLPFDQQKKKEPKSNAKMMRDYRKRVKADPIKYQRYLEQERERNNRRKRRKRKELKELNESEMLNDAVHEQMMYTEITDITEPLEQSLITYNTETMASTALESPIGCKIEFKTKPSLHVAPAVRINPVQSVLLAGQAPLEHNNVIQIRPSLPIELQQAFNIKIINPGNVITSAIQNKLATAKPSSGKRYCVVEPVNTSTTSTIANTKLHTENPIPEKRRCIVEPRCRTKAAPVKPTEKQTTATKTLESTKYYTIKDSLKNLKKVSVHPPSPSLMSQDFKITLITLDQAPFRPKIAVIRDRPRTVTAKTGSGYQRVCVSTESTKPSNIGSRTSDGTHDTESSQDGDVEDVTPAARLIDLTDDVSDGESPAFADLTNKQVDVNGISSTSNTDVVQNIGPIIRVEEENKNKLNYLDSYMGFVTQQESETNKQRIVSKGMMWNRYS